MVALKGNKMCFRSVFVKRDIIVYVYILFVPGDRYSRNTKVLPARLWDWQDR